MATPWAVLDLSAVAPGTNLTAANTGNFFDNGYPAAGYLVAAAVSGSSEIGMLPRNNGFANASKLLTGHTAEGRIGFKIEFKSSGTPTSYFELLMFRNASAIQNDVGLRNASGTREVGARNASVYYGQANGNPMQSNEQWSFEIYWLGKTVTTYVWDSPVTTGNPTYTWKAPASSLDFTNFLMGPDSNDGVSTIIYDVWITDGARKDELPIPGTLDSISSWSVGESGIDLHVSGRTVGASSVEVVFNGVAVPATLDSDGYFKAYAPIGLGNTASWEVVVDGVSARTGSTRALPSGDTLRVLIGSCFDTFTSGFFANALARNPDLILDGGDHGYFWLSNSSNGPTAPGDAAAIRALKEPMLRAPLVQSLYGTIPSICLYSDCDGAGANSDSSFIGFTSNAVQSAHKQIFAHGNLPMEENFGRVVVWKRWRIITTDELTQASPKNNSDVAGKTKLGTSQLAWFKDQIVLAHDLGQSVLWFGDGPFHPNKVTTGTSNEWSRYDTERQEIVEYINSLNMMPRIIRSNGDRHSLAIDDGRNNAYGLKTVNAAPFHTTANPYGMPAQESWPTAAMGQTNSSRQYAILELFDDGDQLTCTAKGYSSTNSAPTEVERFNVTFDVTPPPTDTNVQLWDDLYIGAQRVESVYLGNNLIWSS